jgi:uncharacterized repeat protein (TIGR01451 family)
LGLGWAEAAIQPVTALPQIDDPVILDATTQPGYAGSPLVEIDGSLAGAGVDGLQIVAGNCEVLGFAINQFTRYGIALLTNGTNTVYSNYIGTDLTGSLDLGNGSDGIYVETASNTIGGTAASEHNIISGNDGSGLTITGSGATTNQIQGNYIGLNSAGDSGISNTMGGVVVENGATNNTIGGAVAGAGNVISGNLTVGVTVQGALTTGNIIKGNYIGTDLSGMSDVGNTGSGVLLSAPSTDVGGVTAAERNIISGNGAHGIYITSADGTNISVLGNYIGTNATGAGGVANNASGVAIANSGTNNVIGGTGAGEPNLVAYNLQSGIRVDSTANAGNQIVGNSIYDNNALGIDLATNGVTTNDPDDVDTGANDIQNYPVLTYVSSTAGTTTITGTFNSEPSQNFDIHFYGVTSPDGSGYGEGRTYLGLDNISTDANGDASINTVLPVGVAIGSYVTATATNQNSSTSEFSAASYVYGSADLQLTKVVDDGTPNEGDTVTYTVMVTNAGPNNATGVEVTDLLPAGVTYQSDTPSQGTYDSGTGVWAVGGLNNGLSTTLTLVATVDAGTGGSTITNTADVTASDQADPNAANNTASADITVSSADLQLT